MFTQQTRGAVRVEGLGPVTVEQAVDLLRHCHVRVTPVVDLHASSTADGHEVTGRIREIVELRSPIEVFPFGTRSSRRADKDHITAYVPLDEGRPPGQTAPSNLGPLGRYHHRLKTFGGWRYLQVRPGVFCWRSPHGHWARVDATGTHHLGRDPTRAKLVGGSLLEEHVRTVIAGHAGPRIGH